MANSLCFSPLCSFIPQKKSGMLIGKSVTRKVSWVHELSQNPKDAKLRSLEIKATDINQPTNPNSIVCADCDGNGAKLCGQCQGTGVNSVDHFNGQFKAGGLCWLCRGKRDVLCGSCNGAGFIGGFMSTFDE